MNFARLSLSSIFVKALSLPTDTKTMNSSQQTHPSTRLHILTELGYGIAKEAADNRFLAAVEDNGQIVVSLHLNCMAAVGNLMRANEPVALVDMLAPLDTCVFEFGEENGLPTFDKDNPQPFSTLLDRIN